jgi:hypothetical protein
MKNSAPWAPLFNRTTQIFTSDKVAKWVYQEVYSYTNILATELK